MTRQSQWEQLQVRADAAAARIGRQLGDARFALAIVAGSGLGGLDSAMTVERRLALPAAALPVPSVLGHRSQMLFGAVGPMRTVAFLGRVHFYEGFETCEVVSYVALAKRLGARVLLVTNSAGGLKADLEPGDLMMITDHIDLTFRAAMGLANARELSAERGASGRAYDGRLCDALREAARSEKIALKEGIYAGMLGPMYETRAEAAMLREAGADAVGMSTVAEVAAARALGLRVAAISSIVNRVVTWGAGGAVSHGQVVENARRSINRLARLIGRWAEMIADDTNR